ncbi:MAG: DUF6265 family protein [Thermoanaerobaculia bacterium]|nr:DUF6265 family protein [Thermoanaerobaculia bacterium]
MRSAILLAVALLSLPVATVLAESSGADGLEWLLGCWESADGSATEAWVRDSDGSLTGFAVVLSEGELAFFELLRIRRDEEGRWVYVAYPGGGAPTEFVADLRDRDSILFVNPEHDYPQEIAYRREGDRLFARISALGGADPRSFDKRACEAD